MKPYYFAHIRNFGDELNAWLWKRLLPEFIDDRDDILLLGIGTYLNAEWLPRGKRFVVLGAGAGYGRVPIPDRDWHICYVRGPLTARALGLPEEFGITDSGSLVRLVFDAAGAKRYRTAFMPHHSTAKSSEEAWRAACRYAGLHYIDPHGDVETTMREICDTELLVTEALHGAIIADSFRVPWIPVAAGEHILRFKWDDWCQSMHMTYDPRILPDLSATADLARNLESIPAETESQLSSDSVLAMRLDQQQQALKRLTDDWRDHGRPQPSGAAEHVLSETTRRKQIIRARETDLARWRRHDLLEDAWDARAKLAAQFIQPGATVLDIGCGAMALESFLPKSCMYVPCDVVPRDARTLVRDFNTDGISELCEPTIITVLGVLEYVYDVQRFLAQLRSYNVPVVMSYHPTDDDTYRDREAAGWVNNLSWRDICERCAEAGFTPFQTVKLGRAQIVLHMGPSDTAGSNPVTATG